jgi:MerR family transcriptional regulator, mercuric resistance operon regulatory protein
MQSVTIAGLAQAGGVGVETVRYYQRRGLLDTPERLGAFGPGSGVRRYGEADIRRLRFIRSAQAAGFTLDEIAELIELDAGRDRTRAHALAQARIAALDATIAQLQSSRAALATLAHHCSMSGEGPCPILTAFDEP